MTKEEALEHILETVLKGASDLRSPYGLYGYPPMWNLFEQDGVTTAVRPKTVMQKRGFQFEEGPGIAWGRHEDGVWVKGEQHSAETFDWFIEKVMLPALEDGATLCVKGDADLEPDL